MSSQWDQFSAQMEQMGRQKAAEWESYRRQLLGGGRNDIVSAVEQLADAGASAGSFAEGTSAYTRARQIGEEINRVGGFRMMQEIHKLFACAVYAKTDCESAMKLPPRLESAWHGIGSWLG